MFKKVLIANRGEIAVRIIRACRELGITAAVVYSEADRNALHVRLADEAYLVGPAPSIESYLSIDKIIAAAKRARAEAIHPGYGFLSENPNFARACQENEIKLIGPSAEAMELMGNKTAARRVAASVGVAVIPGTVDPVKSADEAREVAAEIGYPIMLKAAAGGGGKGMRLVFSEEELAAAFRDASSEAHSAFGDPSLYIEKYLQGPRHVEMQILADSFGNTVYLGERECSLQRRHQKVLEECPSPIMDSELRRRMGEAAVKIARASGYENAGTVEFLVDRNRDFYFLEMNARLQVEHPITEMVTGIDLVKEQIRIASGERLPFDQDQIRMRGAAIECRIYAEDPENDFLPSPGRIVTLIEPSGPGIRCDSGVYPGYEVPVFYDPLISKLIAHGRTRAEAIERMRRALSEYRIGGIRTTIRFFVRLLQDEGFLRGDYDTGYVQRLLARQRAAPSGGDELKYVAAIAAAIDFCENGGRPASLSSIGSSRQGAASSTSRWKDAGRIAAISRRL